MNSSFNISHPSEIVWRSDRVIKGLSKIWADLDKNRETFTLDKIVKLIEWAWKNDEVVDIVIDGKKGHGKTTLALMIGAYTYRRRGSPDWKKALDSLYFKPTELLLDLIKRVTNNDKVKVVILDDAGAWISKWTITSEKEAFFEAFELSRTLVGSMIFTNVGSLAKYLRMTSSLRIRVRRLKYSERVQLSEYVDNEIVKQSLLDRDMRWSECRVYTTYFDLDYRERYKKRAVFIFPVKMPDKIYKFYVEKRQKYTGLKMVLALVRLAKSNPLLIPEILTQSKEMGVLPFIIDQMCRDRELRKELKNYEVKCTRKKKNG